MDQKVEVPNSSIVYFRTYDPEKKKTIKKQFSKNKYTMEQIDAIGNAWVAEHQAKARLYRQNEIDEKVHNSADTINVQISEIKKRVDLLTDKIEKVDKLPFDEITLDDVVKIIKAQAGTGFTASIIGSSKSGKTYFINNLIKRAFTDRPVILFSPNLNSGAYGDIMNMDNIAKSSIYIPDLVKSLHKLNTTAKKNMGHTYDILLILDDVVDEKEDDQIKKLYTIYRNANISTIMSGQDTHLFKKTNRGNVNFCFFFKLNTNELIKDAVEKYLSGYIPGNINEKIEIYKKLTKNFQIIFLDLLSDRLYVVKAK